MTYLESKYITLVGHVQSGKTNEEIQFCYQSIQSGIPVIFVTRNIRADQLQLSSRFADFNNKNSYNINVKIFSHGSLEDILRSMKMNYVIIILCNTIQLRKIYNILKIYNGKYNVCIDEVDFSIKSKNNETETDYILSKIKQGATNILGATATPVAVFTTQKDVSKIVKLKPNNKYHGIESLNIEFVKNYITNDPRSDIDTIHKIYSNLLEKPKAVLLHLVTKKRKNQYSLMEFISGLYETFTYIMYNGDGIQVLCKNRKEIPFAYKRSINVYGQNIQRYHIIDKDDFFIHFFENYSISEVLQLLVDDIYYKHTHISIFSGNLASRGVSFVSSDYSLHLTDQYFHPGIKTHGENYLQSLRILGCYDDKLKLTLWCNERSWKHILQHNKIINNIVGNIHNNSEWLVKIKEVILLKPGSPLTRNRVTTNFRKISNIHFSLDIDEES